MSREVDPNAKNLSDDDKLYLAQRAQLPTSVMSVEDQRKLLDPESAGPSTLELANTGTVATMTVEELEAALEQKRAEMEGTDTKALFTNPGGLEGASASDDDDESSDRISGDYDEYNKGQLSAEIAARNEEREDDADYEPMALSGSKAELVQRLEEDDEE